MALIANMGVGLIALYSGKTSEIITIACFGAITLYILSLISFFKLRKSEPEMHRPFRAPFYPYAQALALAIAVVSFFSMLYFNFQLGLIFISILALSYGWFHFKTNTSKELA
jgi:ethanolamine permease